MTDQHCRASKVYGTTSTDNDVSMPTDRLPLTETLFLTKIRPIVIDMLIERGIVTPNGNNVHRPQELREYLEAKPEQIETIKRYLQSDKAISKKNIDDIKFPSARNANDLLESDKLDLENKDTTLKQLQEEYRHDKERFLNFLAVQKESLRQLFILVTGQQYGKHYARGPVEASCERPPFEPCFCGGCVAIPADNGRPQNTSLFGSTLERLFYTALLFVQEGVPVELVEAGVRKLEHEFSNATNDSGASGDAEACEDVRSVELQQKFVEVCRSGRRRDIPDP